MATSVLCTFCIGLSDKLVRTGWLVPLVRGIILGLQRRTLTLV